MANLLAKIYFRISNYRNKVNLRLLRFRGATVGKASKIGKINIPWPGSVVIGDFCEIQDNTTFWIQSPFNGENKIVIGDSVFIGRNTEFNCCNNITIGNKCLIGSSTVFVDSNHVFKKGIPIREQVTILKTINIGEDVWIGSNCKILLGVHLGSGCIIGAGAVVNKSVPENEIWAGVPAKKIGERKY